MQLCSQCQECVTRFRLSSPAMSGEAEMNEAGDGGAAASSEKNMRESVACISPLTGKFHFGREVDREREGMLFGEC